MMIEGNPAIDDIRKRLEQMQEMDANELLFNGHVREDVAVALAEITKTQDIALLAFVKGAKWWEFHSTGGTMWNSDQRLVEEEALKHYPYLGLREQSYKRENELLQEENKRLRERLSEGEQLVREGIALVDEKDSEITRLREKLEIARKAMERGSKCRVIHMDYPADTTCRDSRALHLSGERRATPEYLAKLQADETHDLCLNCQLAAALDAISEGK
jgi:hypothetical protein